jgi:hypothetical protein
MEISSQNSKFELLTRNFSLFWVREGEGSLRGLSEDPGPPKSPPYPPKTICHTKIPSHWKPPIRHLTNIFFQLLAKPQMITMVPYILFLSPFFTAPSPMEQISLFFFCVFFPSLHCTHKHKETHITAAKLHWRLPNNITFSVVNVRLDQERHKSYILS